MYNALRTFSFLLMAFIFCVPERDLHAKTIDPQDPKEAIQEKTPKRNLRFRNRGIISESLQGDTRSVDVAIEEKNNSTDAFEKKSEKNQSDDMINNAANNENDNTLQQERSEIFVDQSDTPAIEITSALTAEDEHSEAIEFNFEDASLDTLIKYVQTVFDITLLTDDMLEPMRQGSKSVKGNKITFRTNKPLTRLEAFNLFLTFLDVAGFTLIAQNEQSKLSTEHPIARPGSIFRIQPVESANKEPIRVEIGTPYAQLPDSNEIIRYLYFIENSSVESITNMVNSLRSNTSGFIALNEHKGFIITDRAYNIKKLMEIVREVDQVSIPESMTRIKLQRADAEQVKQLYQALIAGDDRSSLRLFPSKKSAGSSYFSEDIKIITEPRTNSLILLGAKDALAKIEDFIKTYIDIELDHQQSPLFVYRLKHADAESIANLMNEVAKFGQNTPAGKTGSVRAGDQFFKPMSFTAEKATNSIVIRGDPASYLIAKETLEKLDEPQPQVVIEALILQIDATNLRALGTQLRSKDPGHNGLTGKNVKFQTSGIFTGSAPTYNAQPILPNTDSSKGIARLLGDLINVAVGAPVGNTIITLGQDIFGVWGVFQALQTVTNVHIVSNPFLTATNKTQAVIALGEERRVKIAESQASTVSSSGTIGNDFSSFAYEPAQLTLTIMPQINSEGMIILDINIDITEFTNPISVNDPSATRTTKNIKTQTTIHDNEMLALGGLIRNKITSDLNKTPLLGDIPLLGWLFKNKKKGFDNQHLLVLISAHILKPDEHVGINRFTQKQMEQYKQEVAYLDAPADRRDPVDRMFFAKRTSSDDVLENNMRIDSPLLIDGRNSGLLSSRRKRQARKAKRSQKEAVLPEQLYAQKDSRMTPRYSLAAHLRSPSTKHTSRRHKRLRA